MEEGFTFWSDRLQIIALLDKAQFDKLLDQKWNKKPEMKEVVSNSLFNNGVVILWKNSYGYDLKLFTKIKKLAKELELDTILMPDSDKEFPMAFANSERSVFLILAPKMFDGNAEVQSFASNWGSNPKGDSKIKEELDFTRDVLLKATKDDLAKACVERNELLNRLEKLKEIINQSEKEAVK
jgi:hypothetical protein